MKPLSHCFQRSAAPVPLSISLSSIVHIQTQCYRFVQICISYTDEEQPERAPFTDFNMYSLYYYTFIFICVYLVSPGAAGDNTSCILRTKYILNGWLWQRRRWRRLLGRSTVFFFLYDDVNTFLSATLNEVTVSHIIIKMCCAPTGSVCVGDTSGNVLLTNTNLIKITHNNYNCLLPPPLSSAILCASLQFFRIQHTSICTHQTTTGLVHADLRISPPTVSNNHNSDTNF